MSAPFRFPKFFVTNPSPCPYLPGKVERKVFTELSRAAMRASSTRRWGGSDSAAASPSPTAQAASTVRPACRFACSRPSSRPTPRSASCLRKHADLEVTACKPWTTEEQYELLQRYLEVRHPGGGMAEMDESDFADMVEQTPVRTYVVEYREPSKDGRPGKLVGACLSDQQGDGLSMIYSFFDVGPGSREGPRHLHHPRPHHPRGAGRAALRLSRLLGRRLAAHGLQDALPPARAARPRRLAANGRCGSRCCGEMLPEQLSLPIRGERKRLLIDA